MNFEKKVIFLGSAAHTLRDGTMYYSVNLFDPGSQDTVAVNVMASNTGVVSQILSMSFGTSVVASFALRLQDKRLYRLALVGLSDE